MIDLTILPYFLLLGVLTVFLKNVLDDLNDVYLKEQYRSKHLWAKLDYFRIHLTFNSHYFKPEKLKTGRRVLWLFHFLWMMWLIVAVGLFQELF